MRSARFGALVLGASLLLVPSVRAEGFVFTGVGVLSEGGTATGGGYWDNTSFDGPQTNIGFFLTGTGAFSTQHIAPGDLQAFQVSSGSATGMSFSSGGAGAIPTVIRLELTVLSGSDQLWVRNADGTFKPIFSGSDGVGATKDLYPVIDPFQLVLLTKDFHIDGLHHAYFSTGEHYEGFGMSIGLSGLSAGSLLSTDAQHFAVFRNANVSNGWWIGIEDQPFLAGDEEYNDMVIKMTFVGGTPNVIGNVLTTQVIPTPPSAVLIGLGALGAVALRRRRVRRPTLPMA